MVCYEAAASHLEIGQLWMAVLGNQYFLTTVKAFVSLLLSTRKRLRRVMMMQAHLQLLYNSMCS